MLRVSGGKKKDRQKRKRGGVGEGGIEREREREKERERIIPSRHQASATDDPQSIGPGSLLQLSFSTSEGLCLISAKVI